MTTATPISPPLRTLDGAGHTATTVLKIGALILTIGVVGFAAIMKLTTGNGGTDIAIGALEIAFIAGLIAFRNRPWAWMATTALFAMFAGFTAHLMSRGEGSCGCFGAIETAPTLTFSIDLFMAALAATVALTMTRSLALIGVVLTLAGGAFVTGAGASVVTTTPLASSFHGDRAAMLLDAEANADIAATDLTGPDWLIYVYDDSAGDDAPMLDVMSEDAATNTDDESLRVRVMTAAEAEEASGVPTWAWEKLPQAILYRGGSVVERSMGGDIASPDKLRTSRPVGPIAQVLALPRYGDIAYASEGSPIYIVYVYNPECPTCLEHLALLDHFTEEFPNDRNVAIALVDMLELQDEIGIEIWQWPGVPTSYIVENGRVIAQTAGPGGVPNPYQIRMDLMNGRSLVLPSSHSGATQEPISHEGHDHD